MTYLENVDVETDGGDAPLRLPVQWVNRRSGAFRGFAGAIASGRIQVGDEIVAAASGRKTKIARIVAMGGDLVSASAPDSVMVTFADEIDSSRRDVLRHPTTRPNVADQFAAHLIWMRDDSLLPGRSYLMRINGRSLAASVTEIKHKLDVDGA